MVNASVLNIVGCKPFKFTDNAIHQAIKDWEPRGRGEGLLVDGCPGIGKSTQVYDAVTELAKRQKRKIYYAALRDIHNIQIMQGVWQQLAFNMEQGKDIWFNLLGNMHIFMNALSYLKKKRYNKPICVIDDGQRIIERCEPMEKKNLVDALGSIAHQNLADIIITFSEQSPCREFKDSKCLCNVSSSGESNLAFTTCPTSGCNNVCEIFTRRSHTIYGRAAGTCQPAI